MHRPKKWGVEKFVFSSRQGFRDLADRLARLLNVWLSLEPEQQGKVKAAKREEHA